MLSEESHALGVAESKIASHEDAAHEKRNWVRLTFECNNRCTFCLDSNTHNGEMRDREEVKQQILDGRQKGATRLILSGGEPTIHPNYVDFIKLGKMAGYRKVQTVTNGRLFGYPFFLKKCLDAGLSEITFSLHGPNAKIHDALVGVKGAFEQESQGLRNALADGRPIVNVDIVINKGNVKVLPEMLDLFISWGVREFDLLQVVPFGRAFTEGRESLFYDLEEMQPYIRKALEYSKRPDLHLWFNRFPPQHLEGFEHLIQDPYKLNDEVRGRKEEFEGLLSRGVDLDCRDPARCKYCYLQKLCDKVYDTLDETIAERFDRVRFDTTWEAQQQPVFGGDPASARRAQEREAHALARAEAQAAAVTVGLGGDVGGGASLGVDVGPGVNADGSVRLPVVDGGGSGSPGVNADGSVRLPVLNGGDGSGGGGSGSGGSGPGAGFRLPVLRRPKKLSVEERVRSSGARLLWVRAPEAQAALEALARFEGALGDGAELELELDEYSALPGLLVDGKLGGRRVVRAVATSRDQAERVLGIAGGEFEVMIHLTRDTAAWLSSLDSIPSRVALMQPTYERLTESQERDVDLRAFFASFKHVDVPVEGVPACVLGREPRPRPKTLDLSMLTGAGELEAFRFTRRYILEHYMTKSLRCSTCAFAQKCEGLHINYVRAHGYAVMQPVA